LISLIYDTTRAFYLFCSIIPFRQLTTKRKEEAMIGPSFPFKVEKPSSFVHTDGIPIRHIAGRTGWWCSFAKEIDFLASPTFQVHYPCI